MGYACEETKDDRIGNECGGHDFAIVQGRWLVDYWARYVTEDQPFAVYDMANALDSLDIVRLYGSFDLWSEIKP